jgi:uncharacterized protein (DUF58 family)
MTYRDARRIDVRVNLRDPFVRRFQFRALIDLHALIDLSGPLGYEGHARKMDLVTTLCVALARSATRAGDQFGLIGCDATPREDCFIPATQRRGIVTDVAHRLARARCHGTSAIGLTLCRASTTH